MTNLKDYMRDLVIEIRDEVLDRQEKEQKTLTDEEIDDIIDTYIRAIKKRLIGGD